MALRKYREDFEALAHPRISAASEGYVPAPSPARVLQQRLRSQSSVAVASAVDKWSTRRSLALIVTSSCALWLAILSAATQAAHVVA